MFNTNPPNRKPEVHLVLLQLGHTVDTKSYSKHRNGIKTIYYLKTFFRCHYTVFIHLTFFPFKLSYVVNETIVKKHEDGNERSTG